MTMSTSGAVAAGTADGRLYLGFGGEKASTATKKDKKKSKKWEGLDADHCILIKAAEGPIVAM